MSATRRARITIALASAAFLFGLVAQPGWAQPGQVTPPPRLADELLVGFSTDELGNPTGTSELSGNCDQAGNSSFTYTVTGEAWGPYVGVFTETGSFTLGPAVTQPDGNVVQKPLAFQATFTIVSESITITGRKWLSPKTLRPYNWGACGDGMVWDMSTPNAAGLQVAARYEAVIPWVDGRKFIDRGVSRFDYTDLGVRDIPFFGTWHFIESFARPGSP